MADMTPSLKEDLFSKHLPRFVNDVNPIEILPHLNCLTPYMKEEIVTAQRSECRRFAVNVLHMNLIKRPDWYGQLQAGLRHRDIKLSYLADLLDPPTDAVLPKENASKTPLPTLRKRKQPGQEYQKVLSLRNPENPILEPARRKQGITGATPVRKLSAHVIAILKRLDIDTTSNWEELAGYLDYTFEDVQMIEAHKGGSPALELIKKWSTRPEATLGKLMHVLKFDMDRLDIVTELEKTTGFKLPDETTTVYSRLADSASKPKVPVPSVKQTTTPNMDKHQLKVSCSSITEMPSLPKTGRTEDKVVKQTEIDKTDSQGCANKSLQCCDNPNKTVPLNGGKLNFHSTTSMVALKQENSMETDKERISKLGDTGSFLTSEDQQVKIVSVLRQESEEPGPYLPVTGNGSTCRIIPTSDMGDIAHIGTDPVLINNSENILQSETRNHEVLLVEPELCSGSANQTARFRVPSTFSGPESFISTCPDLPTMEETKLEMTKVSIDTPLLETSLSLQSFPSKGHCEYEHSVSSLPALDCKVTVGEAYMYDIGYKLSLSDARPSDMGAIPKRKSCLLPRADILERCGNSIDSSTSNYSNNSVDFDQETLNTCSGDFTGMGKMSKDKCLPRSEILAFSNSGDSDVTFDSDENVNMTSVNCNYSVSSSDTHFSVNEENGMVGEIQNEQVRQIRGELCLGISNNQMGLLPTSDILEFPGSSISSFNGTSIDSIDAASTGIDSNNYSTNHARLNQITLNGEKPDHKVLHQTGDVLTSVAKKQKYCIPTPDILDVQENDFDSNNYSLTSSDHSITLNELVNNEKVTENGINHWNKLKAVEGVTIVNRELLDKELVSQNSEVLSDRKEQGMKKEDDLMPNMVDYFPDDSVPPLYEIQSENDKRLLAKTDGKTCINMMGTVEKIKYFLLNNLVHILTSIMCAGIMLMYKYCF